MNYETKKFPCADVNLSELRNLDFKTNHNCETALIWVILY